MALDNRAIMKFQATATAQQRECRTAFAAIIPELGLYLLKSTRAGEANFSIYGVLAFSEVKLRQANARRLRNKNTEITRTVLH